MVAVDQAEHPDRLGAGAVSEVDLDLTALDRLEAGLPVARSRSRRIWSALWPKLTAIGLALAIWQVLASSGWKPSYLLPGPGPVARAMWDDHRALIDGTANTLRRAVEGYVLALLIGTAVAILITRIQVLRTAVSPLITGLQTMPSVAWVPFAILIFQLSERAILFVTVLGAAPAIAVGAIAGIDSISPNLHRAGQVLGARGWQRYRHVVLPAALPGYVTGMKQGWAFAWRSLMAGELIANVAGKRALGQLLETYRDQSLSADMMGTMVVILIIGLLLDGAVFGRLERAVLRRRGLITETA